MVTDLEDNHLDSTIKQILRTRVVNTTGHEYVKEFIIRWAQRVIESEAGRDTKRLLFILVS